MKYIIEIEDVPFSKVRIDADNGAQCINLYRVKGFNALVFDKNGLDKLTPLDKELEEAYQKGVHDGSLDVKERVEGAYQKGFEAGSHETTTLEYQQGLDDAWEAAKKIFGYEFDGGLPFDELRNAFGFESGPFCTADILRTNTASEALAKIKAYEEQQKADEIKVGDEVEAYSGIAVVFGTFTDTKGNKYCRYWYPSESRFDKDKTEHLKKTGRHNPLVEELLEAMKEGAE